MVAGLPHSYQAGQFITIDPHQFEPLERWVAFLEDEAITDAHDIERCNPARIHVRTYEHVYAHAASFLRRGLVPFHRRSPSASASLA